VEFDAVESGGNRIGGRALEAVDDARNFRKLECARLGNVDEGTADEGLAVGANRRRRDRPAAVQLQRIVRDPPDMPELDENAAAARMHAVCDLAPAGNLFFRVDARRVLITLTLLRNLTRLGDQETRGSALRVILGGERTGHQTLHRAVARQWRHHETVGKRDRAKFEGLEEFRRLAHFCDAFAEKQGRWVNAVSVEVCMPTPCGNTFELSRNCKLATLDTAQLRSFLKHATKTRRNVMFAIERNEARTVFLLPDSNKVVSQPKARLRVGLHDR